MRGNKSLQVIMSFQKCKQPNDSITSMDISPPKELVREIGGEGASKELKKYTGVAGRILNMLCTGLSPEEAAQAVGVDSSFVRHLKQEPDFIEQIKIKLQENTERAIQIDENYAAIEKQATDRLKTLLPLIHSPRDLMQLAAFANAAKKKTSIGPAAGSEGASSQPLVKVIMPTIILNNFTVNPNNEIVQAGGRTLTTLNSTSITSLIERAKDQQAIEHQQEVSKPALLQTNAVTKPSRSPNYVSQEDLDKL